MKIRIYYDDTDAGGIVYHANYLKYCERARSEVFFSHGLMPFEGDKSGFVVRKVICDFLGRARLGDTIEIVTFKKRLKKASLELVQEIYLDEEKIFAADITLAYLRDAKPSRIPAAFAALFETLPSFEG